jgi:hypothetical protein
MFFWILGLFLWGFLGDIVAGNQGEKANYDHPVIDKYKGSTKLGSALIMFPYFAPVTLLAHIKKCDDYCYDGESKGKEAYEVFAGSSDTKIVDDFEKATDGAKCFLYCHRYKTAKEKMRHFDFTNEFLRFFAQKKTDISDENENKDNPTTANKNDDPKTIQYLAAFLGMQKTKGDYEDTFLHRYLKSHLKRLKSEEFKSETDRFYIVLKGLKDYHCKTIEQGKDGGKKSEHLGDFKCHDNTSKESKD